MIFAVFMTLVTFSAINLLGFSDYLDVMFREIGFLFYNRDYDYLYEMCRSISGFLRDPFMNNILSAIATIPFSIVYIKLSYKYE